MTNVGSDKLSNEAPPSLCSQTWLRACWKHKEDLIPKRKRLLRMWCIFLPFHYKKPGGGQRCLSKYLKRHLSPLYFIKGHPLCVWIYQRFAPSLLPACGKAATTKQQLYSQVHISMARDSPSPSKCWALLRGCPFAHWRSWRLYKTPHGTCLWGNHPSHSTSVHVLLRCGRAPLRDPFTINKSHSYRYCV